MKKIYHNPIFNRISQKKREKILNTAIDEFAEKGFNGVNINNVAQKAGISIGAMYKYFSSKDNLYFTVVNMGILSLEKALEPILKSDTPLMEKIESIIDTIINTSQQYSSLTRLYNRFTSENDSALSRQLADSLETISANAYKKLLQTAKKEGVISKEIDESVFAFCIDNLFLVLQFSMCTDYYQNRLKIYMGQENPDQPDQLKKQMFLFIKRALTCK